MEKTTLARDAIRGKYYKITDDITNASIFLMPLGLHAKDGTYQFVVVGKCGGRIQAKNGVGCVIGIDGSSILPEVENIIIKEKFQNITYYAGNSWEKIHEPTLSDIPEGTLFTLRESNSIRYNKYNILNETNPTSVSVTSDYFIKLRYESNKMCKTYSCMSGIVYYTTFEDAKNIFVNVLEEK